MATLNVRTNDALKINISNADKRLTVNGSNWLWAVTAVMGLTFLGFLAWTISRNKQPKTVVHSTNNHPVAKSTHDDGVVDNSNVNNGTASAVTVVSGLSKERVFHYLFTIAAFIAFISYFTMASNLGSTPIRQYMRNGGDSSQTREVFFVRYIYYVTAWPLVLTAVLLLSGLSWATIFFIVALQDFWILSWLCGAILWTSYKWGYYVFGLFAYFILSYLLLSWGIKHSGYVRTKKTYTLLAGLLVAIWAVYAIAWGLSEGSNKLSVTGENIFYGILDIFAIPIFGSLFLFLVSKRVGPEIARFTQTGRVHDSSQYGNSYGMSSGQPAGHNNQALNNGDNTELNGSPNQGYSGVPAVSGSQV